MSTMVKCGSCGKTLSVKEDMAGKRVRCPHCQQVQQLPGPKPEEFPNLRFDTSNKGDRPAPRPQQPEDDQEDRPPRAHPRMSAGPVTRVEFGFGVGFRFGLGFSLAALLVGIVATILFWLIFFLLAAGLMGAASRGMNHNPPGIQKDLPPGWGDFQK